MKSVGEYLKNLRITQDHTLEQAALVTKISKGTLTAIENADLKNLPAKSYLRGFVFSYGKFLGADSKHLEKLFAQELGSTNPEVTQEEISKNTWKTVPLISSFQLNAKTYVVCSLIALTLLAVATQKVFQKYKKETIVPDVEVTQLQDNAGKAIESKVSADSTVDNNAVASTQQNPQRLTTAAEINQNTFISPQAFTKEVLIEANQDTAIKIKIGTTQEKMVKLLKGDFHTIKAKSKITLETVDLNDIKVIYNGTLRAANENEIKAKTLSF